MNHSVKYSVIVLLEEDSVEFSKYILTLYKIFLSLSDPFEILIIANGMEGFLRNELKHLEPCRDRLKLFALNRKNPQSICLNAAVKESSGEIIVICGSYQQITRDSFIELLKCFDDETDIVSPWRQNRVDPSFNQFQSTMFNSIVKKVAGAKVNDLSCTVKIVRAELLEEIELYGNMYRFLPILAERRGYRVKEVKCEHYQERGKTGFYSFTDYFTRMTDIFTLYFNTRFSRKPLRFFSAIGASFGIAGFLVAVNVFLQKILLDIPIGDRPGLLIAIILLVIGVQAASFGLLGEIIVFTQGRHVKEYNVSFYDAENYSGPERRRSKYYVVHHSEIPLRRSSDL